MAKQKSEPKVVHNTFVVERNFPYSPEVVFDAFADPAKVRQWFANGEMNEIVEFSADFKVGGTDRLVYRLGPATPLPGVALENESRYQEIVPNERIVTVSTMKIGGSHISASQITFELLPTGEGTDLVCTHQGVFLPNSGGPAMREAGWNTLLDRLVKLLSAEGVAA